MSVHALLLAIFVCIVPEPSSAQATLGSGSGVSAGAPVAPLYFPNHGTINALVVFVQHRDDVYDNVLTTDPGTEWPAQHSRGPDRKLPTWARGDRFIAPPGTAPTEYVGGSISQYYRLMSNGILHIHGFVYSRVIIPDQDSDWYGKNPEPYRNGAVKLSAEIIGRLRDDPMGIDFSLFDRYVNGTNELGEDGIFDMLILVFRLARFPNLYDQRIQQGAGAIASLGSQRGGPSHDEFEAAGRPERLGGLRVIDNQQSGSGIIAAGVSKRNALKVVAHEMGHRHFGFYHTHDGGTGRDADWLSVMKGNSGFPGPMSAGDRIKLGWARVREIDLSTIDTATFTLSEPIASDKDEVLRITYGAARSGDVVIEVRTWSNYWDRPPDGRNDDGDHGDFHLSQEGLYFYKVNRDGSRYSSMENTGLSARLDFLPGYDAAFAPGRDAYTPFSRFTFEYFTHPELDRRLAVTNIRRAGDSFTFTVWGDFLLADPGEPKVVATNYAFGDDALARPRLRSSAPNLSRFLWHLGGPFRFEGEIVPGPDVELRLAPGATVALPDTLLR